MELKLTVPQIKPLTILNNIQTQQRCEIDICQLQTAHQASAAHYSQRYRVSLIVDLYMISSVLL